jgi:hypothetical protein
MKSRVALLSAVFIAAFAGCDDGKNTKPRQPTAEEIQQQQENEKRVRDEESAMQKTRPKERSQAQTVNDEERRRQQGR